MTNPNMINDLKLSDSEFIRNNVQLTIESVKQGLEKNEISLCHVVEGLESTLTSSNPIERAFGTSFLADVLQCVSPYQINEKELTFLSAFFIDRLKDHHSIIPHAVVGIISLVKQANICGKDVRELLQGVFREIHCQSHVMADRRNIYNFIRYCFLNKQDQVKKISTEFLLGFISAMEGEKDPRNLVLLFSLFPQIVRALPLHSLAEDLFEVVAAYFPIDFIPPQNDPYGVLPEDLIIGLRGCFAASDAFAPYCFPLLKEKLESDSIPAKLEALLTMKACCESYSATSLNPFAVSVWESVQREVLEGANVEVAVKARDALSAFVAALDKETRMPFVKETVIRLGTATLEKCLPNLSSPKQRLMVPSQDLILASSNNSSTIAYLVIPKVIPLLCEQLNVRHEFVARKNVFMALATFMGLGGKYGLFDADTSLQDCRVQCLKVFSQGLESGDPGVREIVLQNLPSITSSLSKDQTLSLGKSILCSLFDDCWNEKLREMTVLALESLGRANPSLLTEEIVPKILKWLSNAQDEDSKNLCPVLESISLLCSSLESVKAILPAMWKRSLCLAEKGNDKCLHYLRCVRKIAEGTESEEGKHNFLCREWKGVFRSQLFIARCIISEVFSDPVPALEEVSGICQSIACREEFSTVEALVEVALGICSFSSLPVMNSLLQEDCVDMQEVAVLNAAVSSPFIVYSLQGLTQSRTSVSRSENLSLIMRKLANFALYAEDERVRETSSLLFASHILRIKTEEDLTPYLQPMQNEFLDFAPQGENLNLEGSRVRFLCWIVKALIMRAYSGDHPWIQKLETLLLSPDVGTNASKCYEFLLRDYSALVPSSALRNPCAFRMLYKQKFFLKRIDAMVTQFKKSEGKGKINTLHAISCILPCLPHTVLKGYLEKLLPVLAQGMTSDDTVVSSGAVSTLASLLLHNAEDVISHVSTLIPPLISLSGASSIAVKVKALECLEVLARLPPIALMQIKDEVVRGLLPVLDDKKRIVRRAAADARCAWILL